MNVDGLLVEEMKKAIEAQLAKGHSLQEVKRAFEKALPQSAGVQNAEEMYGRFENCEEKCNSYIEFAYELLKEEDVGQLYLKRKSDNKLPSKERMRIPLTVMFVIHNRDIFGYTTILEFFGIVSKAANIVEETVKARILGPYLASEYLGLRYLIKKTYRDANIYAQVQSEWSNGAYWHRYKFLIDVEKKLAIRMEAKANQESVDFKKFRLN